MYKRQALAQHAHEFDAVGLGAAETVAEAVDQQCDPQPPLSRAQMCIRDRVSTMLAERENERQARQDSLTGLLNRYGLLRALDQAVGRASQDKAEFAVLYLCLLYTSHTVSGSISLPFRGSFRLSLTVLVHYRSITSI